jgi:2-isopropylmalate synthase
VFDDFIVLADKKKNIYDADLVALIDSRSHTVPEKWKLSTFHVFAGTGTIPTATLELIHEDGHKVQDASTGDGPVDAAFKCLERVTGIPAKLEQYNVRSVSSGQDAQGEVSVEVESDGLTYHGKGVSTDIIEASARAYLQALNKAAAHTGGRSTHPQHGV